MTNPSQELILVTGATGLIGWHVVDQLCAEGRPVRVMARNTAAARALLPSAVEVVAGDLQDPASVARAVEGASTVFHAAGMPEQWVRDASAFTRVNVDGTRTIAQAALRADVQTFIYTSTIDVFTHTPGLAYDESVLAATPLPTTYERSKQLADADVVDAMRKGLPARFIHPAAVFGPSPTRTPGLNDTISALARGSLPALPPGGIPVVYAPDVARAEIAAATSPVGSRYIVCDRYLPFPELARQIRSIAGSRIPINLPYRAARVLSAAAETAARLTRRAPLLPAGQLHFMTSHHVPNSTKARVELGWSPTDLTTALLATLQ
jgi:dihydroflavonol-4-reductase